MGLAEVPAGPSASTGGGKSRVEHTPLEVHLGSTQLLISLDLDILGPNGVWEDSSALAKLLRVQCNAMHVQHRAAPEQLSAHPPHSAELQSGLGAPNVASRSPKAASSTVSSPSKRSRGEGPVEFYIGEVPDGDVVIQCQSSESLPPDEDSSTWGNTLGSCQDEVVALYDFDPAGIDWPFEQAPLPLRSGQAVRVLPDDSNSTGFESDWALGVLVAAPETKGYFPRNYTGSRHEHEKMLEKLEKKRRQQAALEPFAATLPGAAHPYNEQQQQRQTQQQQQQLLPPRSTASSSASRPSSGASVPVWSAGSPGLSKSSTQASQRAGLSAAVLDCSTSKGSLNAEDEGTPSTVSTHWQSDRPSHTPKALPELRRPTSSAHIAESVPYDVEMPNVVRTITDLALQKCPLDTLVGSTGTSSRSTKSFNTEYLHRAMLPGFEEEDLQRVRRRPEEEEGEEEDTMGPSPALPARLLDEGSERSSSHQFRSGGGGGSRSNLGSAMGRMIRRSLSASSIRRNSCTSTLSPQEAFGGLTGSESLLAASSSPSDACYSSSSGSNATSLEGASSSSGRRSSLRALSFTALRKTTTSSLVTRKSLAR